MNPIVNIGITIGDANGIGPEIALRTALECDWSADLRLYLVGSQPSIVNQAEKLGLPPPSTTIPGTEECAAQVLIWDTEPGNVPEYRPGEIASDAAFVAHRSINHATTACIEGVLDAMVTGPISKEGFHLAGIDEIGHTEMIARLTGAERFGMVLMGGGLRVILATRHLSIRQVPRDLDLEKVQTAIELLDEGLKWFGIAEPRLGVCGLNPHAGDGGALGHEEAEFISPAILAARERGVNVDDVVPADVIFYKALKGEYDGVVAMYHDQGLAPLKMIAFDEGINVTVGLPIIRTSPDHGTAFDIAGRGMANPSSMIAATKLAYQLAQRNNPWK